MIAYGRRASKGTPMVAAATASVDDEPGPPRSGLLYACRVTALNQRSVESQVVEVMVVGAIQSSVYCSRSRDNVRPVGLSMAAL